MIEHPVAVATDQEVEEKVEAVYAELVAKLTGGPAHASKTAKQKQPAKTDALEDALVPVRSMLQADGADLAVTSWENGTVHLELIFSENVCEECILPREELTEMIASTCRETGPEVSKVVLHDPREGR